MTRGGKRLVWRIAASLAAGVVLTVAVAWGLARMADLGHGVAGISYPERGSHRWPVGVPSDWPRSADVYEYAIYFWIFSEDPFIDVVWARGSTFETMTERHSFSVHRFSSGLPMPALASFLLSSSSEFPTGKNYQYRSTLRLARETYYPPHESLPLRPLWPGFALNTVFYGGIIFLLWSTPEVVRRRRRGRRGLCVGCGYDLRGSVGGKCPECGGLARSAGVGVHN